MCSITQSMASLIAINYPKVDKHMERRPEVMASTLNLKYNRCYMYNNFSLRKHVHTLCTKAVVVENVYVFHTVPTAIVEHPESQEVVVSNCISLVCLASGIPPPNITWSREGEGDISNSSESVILSRVVNATHVTSELTLVATGQQDTGQYNCLADNGIATDNVSFYLQILGMNEGYV